MAGREVCVVSIFNCWLETIIQDKYRKHQENNSIQLYFTTRTNPFLHFTFIRLQSKNQPSYRYYSLIELLTQALLSKLLSHMSSVFSIGFYRYRWLRLWGVFKSLHRCSRVWFEFKYSTLFFFKQWVTAEEPLPSFC